MRPTTGKRGLAVLPIGVRQQTVYQRKTLLERCRQRTASVPALSFTRPVGIWKMSPPPVSSTSGRSSKCAKRLAVLAVADGAKAGVRRNFVRGAAYVAAPAAKREILRAQNHKT